MQRHQIPPGTTEAVVGAVADHQGLDETALPPLYEVVDGDALEAMFDEPEKSAGAELSVSFRYAGVTVTVDPDHSVTIEDD